MANAYRAQVPFRLGDKDVTLQIDYEAVGSLMTLLGGKDWANGVTKAFDEFDLPTVAKIIQIAAKRHQPEITVEEITKASPPFQATYTAIEAAIYCFLYGAPNALEGLDLEESKDAEASGTDPLPNGRVRWRERGNWLMKWAYKGASSGA